LVCAVTATVFLAPILRPGVAAACSCAGDANVESSIKSTDIVFEGRPRPDVEAVKADLGFSDYFGAKRFRFDVTRFFKGQLGATVSIFTVDQSSACGTSYSPDHTYLVYARYTDDGLLADYACSRSRLMTHAAEDLALLGAGVEPDPHDDSDIATREGVGCAVSRATARDLSRWHWMLALFAGIVWSLRCRNAR
jgi:hypothetical protein